MDVDCQRVGVRLVVQEELGEEHRVAYDRSASDGAARKSGRRFNYTRGAFERDRCQLMLVMLGSELKVEEMGGSD